MNQFLKSVIAASALVVATAASAAPVTVTVDMNPVTDAFTDAPSTVSFYLAGYGSETVYAGEFKATLSGGASFAAYCFDLKTDLDAVGNYNMTTSQLDSVARLFHVAGFNGQNWTTDQVTGVESAALQLAIWESKYDSLSGYNLGGGSLSFSGVSSAVKTAANTYLQQAKTLAAGSYNANVLLFTPNPVGSTQALVTTVPEPSTYALMAACLGVVGFVARRKKSV